MKNVANLNFIKASTFQKQGKKVPAGPKSNNINETIEKQLSRYRKKIEMRFQ